MSREFHPTSALIRTVFALSAVLATVFVAGTIDGLFGHYDHHEQQAAAAPDMVAQH
jgi:hypothetical protein